VGLDNLDGGRGSVCANGRAVSKKTHPLAFIGFLGSGEREKDPHSLLQGLSAVCV
jgi:hypothetical protein